MASPTDQQLLDQTNNAISAILIGGSSYSINGRSMTRANLKDLWQQKLQLEGKINMAANDATGTGIVTVRLGSPV
jgi:hypothetical protein